MTQDDPHGAGGEARPADTSAADTSGATTSGAATHAAAASGATTSGVDWEAVRHDFLYSGMAQRRIAWQYGVTDETVRKHRRAGGWERVVPLKPLPTHRPRRRTGEPPTPTEKRRASLVKRLFAVLEAKITALEVRMTNDDAPQSAADAERDARTMTALMQIYTKLAALEDAARAANENAGTDGARTDDDADRLRRDLAGRLTRLSDGGDA